MGKLRSFNEYVYEELDKFNREEDEYDPFAVCCAVRKKVEEHAYSLLVEPDSKTEFLDNVHGTSKKLKYVENKGHVIPEVHYLLGIIYNDGMHWKNNEAAIAGKLENYTIRKMIREINLN